MPRNPFGDEIEDPTEFNPFGDEIEKSPTSFFDRFDPQAAQANIAANQQQRQASDAEKRRLATVESYNKQPGWLQGLQAAQDVATIGVDSFTGGWADKGAAKLRSFWDGEPYNKELDQVRQQTQDARDRAGPAAYGADFAGAMMGPSAIGKGTNLLTRLGIGAAEGAGYGLLNASGHDKDLQEGTGYGALFGLGGTALAEGLTKGASSIYKTLGAPPAQRAEDAIFKAATEIGLTPQQIQDGIARLGPEGFAADLLGKQGATMGRNAANVSPEARAILEDAVSGRKAGQNVRVADTLTDAGGLPRGTRQTVEDLQADLYNARKPATDAAYERARLLGHDLPYTPFESILKTPMGAKEYDKAANSLLNRAPLGGPSVTSELARLDQTKRGLDSLASKANRAGDRDKSSQAGALARALRERMDANMGGPEYAEARRLAQEGFAEQDAARIGQDLAGASIPADLPGQAINAKAANPDAIRKAYALQQSENVLNKGSTEGALNRMNTPLGREALEAAFDPAGVQSAVQRLEAEKLFNTTNREIVGNSTTARQLSEMNKSSLGGKLANAIGFGGAGVGAGLATGFSPTMTGAAAMAGRLGQLGIQHATEKAAEKNAPEIARRLIGSPAGIPQRDPFTEVDALSDAMRDYLAKLLGRGASTQLEGSP